MCSVDVMSLIIVIVVNNDNCNNGIVNDNDHKENKSDTVVE